MSAGSAPVTHNERLIFTVSRLLEGVRHVAVGASSPIPAAGAMLLRALEEKRGGAPVRLSILGSVEHNFFTNGGVELFDCAAQGRIDAFFLGGGQIDGRGNVNLVGVGGYPGGKVRWPGSFGSAYLYHLVPRVILFREEHTPRVMVEKVEFVSAPGITPPEIYRKGGPRALLTGRCLFSFDAARGDAARGGFRLESVHAGHDPAEIAEMTGFAFERPEHVPLTPEPDVATLALLRGRVLDELAETYPGFAARMAAEVAQAA